MDKVAFASMASGALAIAFIILGALGPSLYLNSQIYRTGPAPYLLTSNSTYTIETFEIPPMRANTTLTLIATKSDYGNLVIQIINNKPGRQGLPQSFLFPMYDGNTSISYKLQIYQPGQYVVIITSYNSTYTLYISGVWESLYQLKPLLVWGIILLIASLSFAYYWRVLQYRRRFYRMTDH